MHQVASDRPISELPISGSERLILTQPISGLPFAAVVRSPGMHQVASDRPISEFPISGSKRLISTQPISGLPFAAVVRSPVFPVACPSTGGGGGGKKHRRESRRQVQETKIKRALEIQTGSSSLLVLILLL